MSVERSRLITGSPARSRQVAVADALIKLALLAWMFGILAASCLLTAPWLPGGSRIVSQVEILRWAQAVLLSVFSAPYGS